MRDESHASNCSYIEIRGEHPNALTLEDPYLTLSRASFGWTSGSRIFVQHTLRESAFRNVFYLPSNRDYEYVPKLWYLIE
jgi:hypothetical protein